MNSKLEDGSYKTRVNYQGLSVLVFTSYPVRRGVCQICHRSIEKGEIKVTALHHYIYKYHKLTVKKNPLLALDFTIETCFTHHQILDALRVLSEHSTSSILACLHAYPIDRETVTFIRSFEQYLSEYL